MRNIAVAGQMRGSPSGWGNASPGLASSDVSRAKVRVAGMPVPMLLIEPVIGAVVQANEAARILFGMPLGELGPYLTHHLPVQFLSRLAGRDAGALTDYPVEFVHHNRLRMLRLSVLPAEGDPAAEGVWLVVRDETETMNARLSQLERVERFCGLAERLSAPAWLIDGRERVVWHNDAYRDVQSRFSAQAGAQCGSCSAAPCGLNGNALFSPDRWSHLADQVLASGTAVADEIDLGNCGAWRVTMVALPGTIPGTLQVGAIATETRAGAHWLAHELQDVREQERTAVAREIHDNLSPDLTLLRLEVARLAKEVAERRQLADNGVLGMVSERLGVIEEQVQRTTRLTRSLAHNIRLPDITTAGASAGAARLVSSFRESADLQGKLEVQEDWTEPDMDLAVHVHRCLQELLNNIARHSGASRFLVKLGMTGEARWLEVHDDGIGLPAGVRDGQGLRSLRERAAIYGGHVEAHGRPEVDGTSVRITFVARRRQA